MSRCSGSSIWQSLLTYVGQLAVAEKLYMNLSFLTPKGFLRKEASILHCTLYWHIKLYLVFINFV